MRKKLKKKSKKTKIIKPAPELISFKTFWDIIIQRDQDLVFQDQDRSYELFFATAGLKSKEPFDEFYRVFKAY